MNVPSWAALSAYRINATRMLNILMAPFFVTLLRSSIDTEQCRVPDAERWSCLDLRPYLAAGMSGLKSECTYNGMGNYDLIPHSSDVSRRYSTQELPIAESSIKFG